jgi:hypothetical protein
LSDIKKKKITFKDLVKDCPKLKFDEKWDTAMQIAIEKAHNMNLDQYIITDISIDMVPFTRALNNGCKINR